MEPRIQCAKTEDGGFRVILSTLYILVMLVRLYYMRRGNESGQRISRTREERLRLPLLKSCGFLGTITGVLYVFSPQRMKWATLPVPTWSRWVGVGLGAASVPLFAWTHHAWGRTGPWHW